MADLETKSKIFKPNSIKLGIAFALGTLFAEGAISQAITTYDQVSKHKYNSALASTMISLAFGTLSTIGYNFGKRYLKEKD